MVPQSRSGNTPDPEIYKQHSLHGRFFPQNNLSRRNSFRQQMLGVSCMHQGGHLFDNNSVTIPTKEGFLFKNQTLDRTPPPVTFPSMATKHQLCPAFALSTYLAKSAHLQHKNTLFVHPKSGWPLLSGRLSYWIAKAISTFDSSNRGSAHDCRKFGHSLAFTRGILPKVILSHGFWSTINVFIHKYLIPVEEPVIPCIAGRMGI